jgi:hypothetical protein
MKEMRANRDRKIRATFGKGGPGRRVASQSRRNSRANGRASEDVSTCVRYKDEKMQDIAASGIIPRPDLVNKSSRVIDWERYRSI